jgi:hypothetical protein
VLPLDSPHLSLCPDGIQDPPPDYLAPSTDILGGLSTIRGKIAAKGYKSQFDFDLDVFELVSSANDGHFALAPCSLAIFQFATAQNLVSLSSDGVQVPQLYTLGELSVDSDDENDFN